MDAVKFLIKEHNKVRKIFAQISDILDNVAIREKIFEDLCHDLVIYEKMEQTVWYPAKTPKTIAKKAKTSKKKQSSLKPRKKSKSRTTLNAQASKSTKVKSRAKKLFAQALPKRDNKILRK